MATPPSHLREVDFCLHEPGRIPAVNTNLSDVSREFTDVFSKSKTASARVPCCPSNCPPPLGMPPVTYNPYCNKPILNKITDTIFYQYLCAGHIHILFFHFRAHWLFLRRTATSASRPITRNSTTSAALDRFPSHPTYR